LFVRGKILLLLLVCVFFIFLLNVLVPTMELQMLMVTI
jgi:hypothetical protein